MRQGRRYGLSVSCLMTLCKQMKLLKTRFEAASGLPRRVRYQADAKTLASLNHVVRELSDMLFAH
jgi:hypothetical protein